MYVKISLWNHQCQIFIFKTANPEAQGKSFESEIVHGYFLTDMPCKYPHI